MAISRFEDPPSFLFFALLGFLIGIWLVHSATIYDGIPIRSKLTKATGNVTWATLTGKRSAIRFKLADEDRTLQYSQSSGEFDTVLAAIQYGGFGEPLTVLYDAESPRRALFEKREVFEVYEISKADESIRGWTDVDRERHRYERILGWFGAGFIAFSVIPALHAFHAFRLQRRGKHRT